MATRKISPKPLELTQEDLDKVAARKEKDDATKVSPEWRLLSEFGMYYGWEAIVAVRKNEISIDEFNSLLAGARKAWAARLIDLSTVVYTSLVASNSKKPQTAINRGLKEFIKEVRP